MLMGGGGHWSRGARVMREVCVRDAEHMNTIKKRKLKIHTRSVSEIAFKIAETPLKGPKKFFKVCLVGTLNLCLKYPEKIQKTRDESDHSGLRKLQKNCQKIAKLEFGRILPVFGRFLLLG